MYIVLFYNRKLPLADGPSRLGEERSRLRDRVRVGTGRSERVHQVRSRALAHRPASHAHCPCWRAPGAFREAPRLHCPSALLRCAWKNFFTPVMEISPSHLPSLLAGTIRTEQDGWGARKLQEPDHKGYGKPDGSVFESEGPWRCFLWTSPDPTLDPYGQ